MVRCFLIFLLAMCSQTSFATDSSAARLVQVARFDYATKLATTLALEGAISKEDFGCVNAIPLSAYTTQISSFVESRLSSDDIATATSFYESAVGKKYTQHGIAQFYKVKGIPTGMEAPSITDSEMQQIIAFSRSSAGAKLINREFPREMVLATKPWEDKELRACGLRGAL